MKRWKRTVLRVAVSLGICVCGCIPALAGTKVWSTEVENTITTGDVSVSIAEYELDENGEEVPYEDGKVVLPGQNVSKIVRFTNEANDAWIRAKITYWPEYEVSGFLEDLIWDTEEGWEKIGDYFYYQKPLSRGEHVDFFRELRIPAEWGEEENGQSFQVHVTVQAVQTANFIPDFSSTAPWFGVPIEECTHNRRDIRETSGDGIFSIIFKNGTEGFVKDSEDFFEDFASMMPGDIREGSMVFGNTYNRTLDILFQTELPESQPEESVQLLKQIRLKIFVGDQILYDGALHGEKAAKGFCLLENLKRGEEIPVHYELFMPETLNNAYALSQAKVRWIFSAKYDHVSSGSTGGLDSSGDSASKKALSEFAKEPLKQLQTVTKDIAQYLTPLPGTGDTEDSMLLLVMLISAVLAFLFSGEEKEDD